MSRSAFLKIIFTAAAVVCCGLHPESPDRFRTDGSGIVLARKLFVTAAPETGRYFSLLSPLSLEINLTMLQRGSDGKTREQLNALLENGEEDFSSGVLAERLAVIGRSSGAAIRSRMLYDSSATALKNDFLRDIRKNGLCTILPADLSGSKAEAGEWHVFDLFSEFEFSGEWLHAFEPENVEEDFFRAPGLPAEKYSMMALDRGRLAGAADEHWVSLFLPFREDAFELMLLKPRAVLPLEALPGALTAGTVAAHIGKAERQLVNVRLPKFKLSSRPELSDGLRRLGVELDNKADFSRMFEPFNLKKLQSTDSMRIAGIVQENSFFISETHAGGRSETVSRGFGFGCSVALPEEQSPAGWFVTDRPFVFLLLHRPTASVLFIGSYSFPPEK